MEQEKMYVRAEMEVVRLTESVITASPNDDNANAAQNNAGELAMTPEQLIAWDSGGNTDPDILAQITDQVNRFWGSTNLSGMSEQQIKDAFLKWQDADYEAQGI